MIPWGLSSHLGPWPCPPAWLSPPSTPGAANSLRVVLGPPGEKLAKGFSSNALIPEGPRRSRESPIGLFPREVHNVKPKLVRRRVTKIRDRSTAVWGVQMSRPIRDDFEAIRSSHTNTPGCSSPENISDYSWIVLISFSSNIALFLFYFFTPILFIEAVLNV